MRVALVLSDVTVPPKEGLHEQSITFARELGKAHDVNVFAFVRDSGLSAPAIERATGATCPSDLLKYSGSSLLFATFALPRTYKAMINKILSDRPDVVILDGPIAIALAPKLKSVSVIMNWIDPGSRRFARIARSRSTWIKRVAPTIARVLFSRLERRAARTNAPWVFVSSEDALYMRNRYSKTQIQHIPVFSPTISLTREAYSRQPRQDHGSRIVVYVDGRTEHGRNALILALQELSHCGLANTSVRVMARIKADIEVMESGRGLDLEFIEWAPDPLAEILSADATIVPDLVGTGIKNRALQALSFSGTPICTRVALEGIELPEAIRPLVEYTPGRLKATLNSARERGPLDSQAVDLIGYALSSFSAEAVREEWDVLLKRTSGIEG